MNLKNVHSARFQVFDRLRTGEWRFAFPFPAIYLCLLCLFLWSLSIGRANAQVDTSVINGTISDATGSAIAGANVTITNLASQVAVELTSDASGRYSSPPLKPGHYEVRARAGGFDEGAVNLFLEVGDNAAANIALRVAGASQQVTVTAELPPISTESSSVGEVRNAQEIGTLPVNQRNAVRILELTPGTVPTNTQAQATGVSNYRGSTLITVNGQNLSLSDYLVDGINNMDSHGGQDLVIFPLIESIGELRVFNTGADAQFGRSTGGIIDVVIKSGGKDYHGSAFEYARNQIFDARNYFARGTTNQSFSMHQFGGSLGGPVLIPHLYNGRNKTFFFGDYEGVRRDQGLVSVSTVPTTAEVGGDFSAISTKIIDPLTGQQFPGNKIPSSRFNVAGANFAGLYPAQNAQGTVNNYVYSGQRTFALNDADLKVDHYVSDKLWFTFRGSGGTMNGHEPSQLPAPAIGAGPSYPGPQKQPHMQGDISMTEVFDAHTINEVRVGYSRLAMIYTNTTAGTNLAQQLGIPGINVSGESFTSGGVSLMSITGFQSLGDNSATPGNVITDSNQVSDIVTFERSSHTIKAGFQFQRRRYNVYQASYPRGQFAFQNYYSGYAFADLLLGLPEMMRLDILDGTRGIRRSEYSGFVQDSWKVIPKLTLNAGLRYDHFDKTGYEVHNRMANFLPSAGELFVVDTPQLPSRSGTNNSNLNFSPRFGFAYNPRSGTLIRGSYGVYFATLYATESASLAYNAPFVGSEIYINSAKNPAGARVLSQGFTRAFAPDGSRGQLNGVDQNLPTPYNQLWDVGFERQLPGQFVLAADYVGSKTTHFQLIRDINTPTANGQAAARAFPNFTDIYMIGTTGWANYNAVQTTLSRRFVNNLQVAESYTYSHCLDVHDNIISGTSDGTNQDPNNPRADYANCTWDLRHRSVTTASYVLPFGRGQWLLHNADRVTDAFVGGWQLNVIGNLYTGFYFTPTLAASSATPAGIVQRPNLVSGCDPSHPASPRSVLHWFNTSCYASPAAPNIFGNAGRDSLLGPATHEFDMSLFKTVNVAKDGRAKAQFQAQVFNVTNTPQLNNPSATIGTTSAGVISSAGSDATFARTERQIQLGIRVDF
jgi:outer membrane receptor protein involved in Fe transport